MKALEAVRKVQLVSEKHFTCWHRHSSHWDMEIAEAYKCRYDEDPAEKYLAFLRKMKDLAEYLTPQLDAGERSQSFLKLIDEYNYAKYTKGWV